jgi:hypothetical protein
MATRAYTFFYDSSTKDYAIEEIERFESDRWTIIGPVAYSSKDMLEIPGRVLTISKSTIAGPRQIIKKVFTTLGDLIKR